jgi:hypothetical protein
MIDDSMAIRTGVSYSLMRCAHIFLVPRRVIKSWPALSMLVAAGALMAPVFAYEYPLSSESIREAYFVGNRRSDKAADLIGQYVHTFPVPQSGPHIAEIQLLTPFVQIVQRARQVQDYTSQDATQEFLDKTTVLRVLVKIYFTPSYNAILGSKDGTTLVRTDDFWQEFKIRLIQGSEVDADSVRGRPVYASSEKGMRRLTGAEVEADYVAARVRSQATNIQVLSRDGIIVTTTFDLSVLR